MAITTREGLKQYCLRDLGAPVVEINVDDDQLEDRIDEALHYWRLNHHEGVEKLYMKHKIRPSTLTIVGSNAADFTLGAIITGETSGSTARVINTVDGQESEGSTIVVKGIDPDASFVDGETITEGANTAVLIAEDAVFLGEIDTHFIELPDLVFGVTRVLPFAGTQTSKSMFDIQYQLRLNDLYDLTSTSIIYYKMVMSHLSLLDMELNGKPMFRFNRLQGRLYLDITWGADINPGEYVVLECYRALDPAAFTRVWNEPWFKHYVTALFKRMWATNLKKFSNMQLPGGVTINGAEMYTEAMQEIKELKEELDRMSPPLEFQMG